MSTIDLAALLESLEGCNSQAECNELCKEYDSWRDQIHARRTQIKKDEVIRDRKARRAAYLREKRERLNEAKGKLIYWIGSHHDSTVGWRRNYHQLRLISVKRTRCIVEDEKDGKRWDCPIDNLDTSPTERRNLYFGDKLEVA